MDPLLLGETLSGIQNWYYGFWMPARGSNGVAGIHVFYYSNAAGVDVEVQTKSSDDADSAASTIGSLGIGSATPQVYKFDVSNAKDLVRYRLSTRADTNPLDYIHFQFLPPSWAPN